jgi:hypothetical protein
MGFQNLEHITFIFVVFGNKIFQQTVAIPMGTNCAPLLADLFLQYRPNATYCPSEPGGFKNFAFALGSL